MPRASSLGAEIRKAFPDAEVELKPGGKGDFIVTVDGKELWNKRQMDDEFPDPSQVLAKLKSA
ncbi:MAG TPA: Rdx family protein [Planctomycetota bacterium]|nr:Rdx family protein [Planctomycetota bacterium]